MLQRSPNKPNRDFKSRVGVDNFDDATMGLHHQSTQVQTKPHAAAFACSCGFGSIKGLAQLGKLIV